MKRREFVKKLAHWSAVPAFLPVFHPLPEADTRIKMEHIMKMYNRLSKTPPVKDTVWYYHELVPQEFARHMAKAADEDLTSSLLGREPK